MTRQLWIAGLAGALVLLGGCGGPEPTGKVRPTERPGRPGKVRDGAPDILWREIILHDPVANADRHVDLRRLPDGGIRLTPYLPLLFNHEIVITVVHAFEGKLHHYKAFYGFDPRTDAYVQGQIETTAAAAQVIGGYVIVTGTLPVARSRWVDTGSDGTTWMLRIESNTDPLRVRHWVYNLEPSGSSRTVFVSRRDAPPGTKPTPLLAGQVAIVSGAESSIQTLGRIPEDEFIQYVRGRAKEAGIPFPPPAR